MPFIHQVEPYVTEKESAALKEYLDAGGWLTEFKKTEEFERMVADFLGVRFAVALTSGTVGLYLSLLAAGIKKGDRVIVPNYTMIATINAVVWAGAEPVPADIDPETFCLDLNTIKFSACKAMMYVPINGRCGNMQKVLKFCKDHHLILIEDACQALGSKWNGQFLGTFGKMGVISFTPHKLITTGQGGMVVTNDEKSFTQIKKLKDFCRSGPASDWHEGIGYNFKFTDLQAVVGIEQMKIIDFRVKRRKEIFERLRESLGDIKEMRFLPTDTQMTTPWFMDVLLPSQEMRDNFIAHLKNNGIGSRVFYPPINHQKPYDYFGKKNFPVSEDLAYRGVWLPSSIGLKDEQLDHIIETAKNFFKK